MSDEETVDETAETGAEEAPPAPQRYGAVVTDSRGTVVLHTGADDYLEVLTAAHADGFDQLIDLTAVDYLAFAADRGIPETVTPERFEVVTQLINHTTGERLRIRVQVSGEAPVLATAFDLWPGSEALEREVYDMFGIEFADHPDMSRVLMPDDWVGHPLRKDYAVGSIPVQFKAASNIR